MKPLLLCSAAGALFMAAALHLWLGIWAWPVLLAGSGLGATAGTAAAALWAWRRPPSRPAPWWAWTLGLAGGLFGHAWLSLSPAGPAVMLIVVDCMRADRLHPTTAPQLSALQASSTTFTRAHAQSSWTRSSVPSILTGRMPIEHRMYRIRPTPDRMPDEVTLVSELFQRAGWATALFARQRQLDAAFGFERGFDRAGSWDGLADELQARFLLWHYFQRSQPRFVYLHYIDLHSPYTPRPAQLTPNLPDVDVPLRPVERWNDFADAVKRGERSLSRREATYISAHYDGEMRGLDKDIGRLLDRLQADGSLDQTWLVLSADHGEAFGEHGRIEHVGTPWQVLLEVPLLIRPPGGQEQGVQIDDLVQGVDIAPTLLGAAGLPIPAEMAGRDLGRRLRGEVLAEVPIIAEERAGPVHRVALRWRDWKLIQEGERRQLYHLTLDPEELRDLAEQQPERLAELSGMLATWFEAAAVGQPYSSVDWEAAGRSGKVWTQPAEIRAAEATEADEALMKGLEALGYL